MTIVTASQMQELDGRTIHEAGVPGTILMERAGTGVVEALETTFGSLRDKTFTIFCGKGNNGGDGFVVARLLRRKRAKVHVCLLANPRDLKGDAKTMYQRFAKLTGTSRPLTNPTEEKMRQLCNRSDFLIDALLGTGITSPIQGQYQTAVDVMNASEHPTIAVDIPSGIHTDTGAILGSAVQACLTVTFGCPKLGLYLGSAVDNVGIIHCVDIGIPPEYITNLNVSATLMTVSSIKEVLPVRKPSSHKGTFGHVGIIAGSPGKTGAAALSALGALRVGTGLVTVATPQSANSGLEAKTLEAMTIPMPETPEHTLARASMPALQEFAHIRDAIGIGPGLTTQSETVQLIRELLPEIDRPCVIDADALNALAGQPQALQACRSTPVLTPHPGEMARLMGHTNTLDINANRLMVSQNFSQTHACVLVLKGARTIVAGPDGQAAICPTGNPGMATAGMGDVLTGMISGFLAQGLTPWQAARAGVFLHGLAGDLAAKKLGEAGLIARDLLDQIPQAIQTVQHGE
ncbi:NAD(P)H-hydrate dehydratase [Candidatus Nitronereus thalassa]|uniref:Bifunctional NAD(P)H-hydrate repair enzyme n=1 Tax=Candidatus Nitronereus thalassa TaxID=3020898 RepID=A0ABU3K7B9_9BACT|nr:NAD(P)H-hydrate dehydratase [Candidatus Nitronereus thalassa]MDT7042301.1 NAD(P)H-hydrate dehydratase [Candidatus Nitronereus thalassa]